MDDEPLLTAQQRADLAKQWDALVQREFFKFVSPVDPEASIGWPPKHRSPDIPHPWKIVMTPVTS